MTTCVFVGPTISARAVRERVDALVLPPARQGDVLRAISRFRVEAIGLVDGYFRSVPSVWHKEILAAIGAGVRVYGAASMGALRAAELDAFGMRGCGRIYEAYRAGVFAPYVDEAFEDDDEVAVEHGPAITGYAPLSEAMVNVRATLARAVADGVLARDVGVRAVRAAKRRFYAERTWGRVLESIRADAGTRPADALEAWLGEGRIDQKRDDALVLLATMAAEAGRPAPVRGFRLARTRAFERLAASVESAGC